MCIAIKMMFCVDLPVDLFNKYLLNAYYEPRIKCWGLI